MHGNARDAKGSEGKATKWKGKARDMQEKTKVKEKEGKGMAWQGME